MKKISNDIILRPRFQIAVSEPKERILEGLQKSEVQPFVINRLDEHIFIKFNTKEKNFWSPQVHLEIVEIDKNNCTVYGVFGPNPTLWTFFMFLHFAVATLFIIFGIWAYSSASLGKPYGLQLGLSIFMVLLWFVLYGLGRMGKRQGRPQTEQLYRFIMGSLIT